MTFGERPGIPSGWNALNLRGAVREQQPKRIGNFQGNHPTRANSTAIPAAIYIYNMGPAA